MHCRHTISLIIFFKLLARGVPVTYPTVSKVRSIDDVLQLLRKVYALDMCDGPGFGSFCKVGFYKKIPTSRCDRCKECQSQYRRNSNNARKRKKRAQVKEDRSKKLRRTLKQKVTRSTEKVNIPQHLKLTYFMKKKHLYSFLQQ